MDCSSASVVNGEKVLQTCLSFVIMGACRECRYRGRYRDIVGLADHGRAMIFLIMLYPNTCLYC